MNTLTQKPYKYKNTEIGDIPDDWELVTLGNISGSVSETYKFTDEQVVFLNTSDIYEGKVLHSDTSDPKILPGQAKKRIRENDILFSEIRPANKRYAYIDFDTPRHVVSTKLMVLRAQPKVLSKYLYTLLTCPKTLTDFQILAESRSGTFPQITFQEISGYPVALPTLAEQQQIVDFLFSINEKIEIDKKMNKTLEEIGKTLFKRWFVDFEFPFDFAQGKPNLDGKPYKSSGGEIVDSELGEIPERWKVGEIGQLCKVKSGFAFQSSAFQQTGEYGVIKIKNIIDPEVDLSEVEFVNEELLRSKAKEFILVPGDTLIAMSGNTTGKIGLMSQTTNKYVLNQRVGKYFFNEEIYKWFIYLFLRNGSTQQDIVQTAYGSAQPNISPSILEGVRIAIPERIIFEKFYQLVNPIITLKIKNWGENSFLAQIRDSLLPRLMSGKLRVNV